MNPRVRVTVEYLEPLAEGIGLTPFSVELESAEFCQERQVELVARPDGRTEMVPASKATWSVRGVEEMKPRVFTPPAAPAIADTVVQAIHRCRRQGSTHLVVEAAISSDRPVYVVVGAQDAVEVMRNRIAQRGGSLSDVVVLSVGDLVQGLEPRPMLFDADAVMSLVKGADEGAH